MLGDAHRSTRTLRVILMTLLLLFGVVAITGANGESTSADRTFCIAQHPSPTVAAATEAAGGVYADAGLPFIISGRLESGVDAEQVIGALPPGGWQEIWPGTPDGKRALVTVCLMGGSGGATVRWTEGQASLDPGDSITVFSSHVEVGGAPAGYVTLDGLHDLEVAVDYSAQMYVMENGMKRQVMQSYLLVPAVYGTYTITLDLCS